jgi:DNA invertase Pin-like site-specific DNA recombinase
MPLLIRVGYIIVDAGIYLRQSLDRHGDMLAVDRQREDCAKLCADRGWTVTEYVDNDISASNGKHRPSYQQMLADISAGRINAVVAWDLDRLYRQPRELEDLIDLADDKHLALATVTGDVDLSTDNGRLYARIKGAVARGEVERKSARQRRAAAQRADQGAAWWSSRPFGYTVPLPPADGEKWSVKGQDIILAPDEAALLRDAYTAVLAGASLSAIAVEWTAKRISTTQGNRWSGTQIGQLLLSPRNAGLRAYRGQIIGPASWPAIVERDVFDGVAAILSDPGRRNGPTRGRKHLLTAIALCGACRQPMGSGVASSSGAPIYTCKNCYRVSRDIAKVDKWVIGLVVERLSRPDAYDLLATAGVDIAALRDRAAVLRARQEEAAALFADGDITAPQLKVTTAKLAAQLADVENAMFSANTSRVFEGVIGAADVRAKFDGLSLDRRRAVINALLSVMILPGQASRGVFRTDLVPVTWK